MNKVTLRVQGMSCGHCVRAVKDALSQVEGATVEKVEIGSAVVVFDPQQTSTGALVDAVADAGYEAQEASSS